MIMTLHKLIHIHKDDELDGPEDGGSKRPAASGLQRLSAMFRSKKAQQNDGLVGGVHDPTNEKVVGHTEGDKDAPIKKLRTLQRYHAGPNEERMEYLERHSVLTQKKMAVSAEQVSIFLTSGTWIRTLLSMRNDECSLKAYR
jgi:hypothetical protein